MVADAARVCWWSIHVSVVVVVVVMLSTPHVAAASQWHPSAEGPAAAASSGWRGQWTDERSQEPWKHRLQHLRRVLLGESRDRGCCIYLSVTQKGKCGVGD